MADNNKTSITLVADVQDVQQKLDQVAKKLGDVGSAGIESAEKINQGYTSAARGVRSISEQLESVQSTIAKGAAIGAFAASIGSMVSALNQAQQAGEKLKNSLEFSVGASNIASELEYLRNVTRKLGLDYTTAADSYAKFSASVKGSGVSLEQTRNIFEGVAQATAKFGLSAEDAQGVFLALSQMASKGVVSSEELRGQLAERLPGAMRIAAQAMGVTEREFSKMLETGQILASDFLPKFGQALKDGITAPMNSLTQEINRLNSAWDQWKQAFANSDGGGFKWLTNGLNESAAAMRRLGQDAGVVQKLLMAIGGFQFGAAGNGAFDTQRIQEQKMAELASVVSQRNSLQAQQAKGSGYLNAFDKQTLGDLIRQEEQLRSELLKIAEQRGRELFKMPDIKGEYEAQQAKRKSAFDAYMKDVQTEKEKEVTKENERFAALTAVIGTSGKDYESALAAHKAKLADINKKSDGSKNNMAQTYAAMLSEEKDYAKTAVEIIQEKVRQQQITEKEGVDQTLAAQNDGFVRQAALLKEQLSKTTDKGDREKIRAQIVALGNDSAVAAEKAASAFKKLDDESLKAYQNYMKGLGDETASLLEKAKASDFEISTIGKSADEIARLTAARYDERIELKEAEAERLRGVSGREAELFLVEQQIAALNRLKDAEVTKPKLQAQAREWEKFTDQINQSLTDALYRSFESGESFGKTFAKNLQNTFKSMALKFAIQATMTTGGNLLNTGINYLAGTSGDNGGSGTNYLGLASNANSIYNLANGSTYGTAVNAWNNYAAGTSIGGYTLGYIGAGGSGITGSMFASGTTAAMGEGTLGSGLSGSLGMYGTGSTSTIGATGAANGLTGTGTGYLSATAGEAGTAGTGGSMGASSGAMSGATVAWVAAIIMGMYMSSQAWKAGYKTDGTKSDMDNPTSWPMRHWDNTYQFDKAIFGKDLVQSELYAIITGSSLSIMMHDYIATMTGNNGAPKTNVNTRFSAGVNAGYTANPIDNGSTAYAGGQADLAAAIFNPAIVLALSRFKPEDIFDVTLAGHINNQGRSNNQKLSEVIQDGETIYRHRTESGKGIADFNNYVNDAIPKMQLAIIAEAMRDSSADYKGVVDLVLGTSKDLTNVISSMSQWDVTNSLSSLLSIADGFDSFKLSVGGLGITFNDLANTAVTARNNAAQQKTLAEEQLAQAQAAGDSAAVEALKTQIDPLTKAAAEKTVDAVARVMRETQTVQGVLEAMGKSLSKVFNESTASRLFAVSESLVNMFGSIDALTQSFNAYYENFYTSSEKAARSWELMQRSFDGLHLAMPSTREGFRKLVDGLDMTTTNGQATFKTLMDLQGAFANLTPTLEDTAVAANAAAEAERKRIAEERYNLEGQLLDAQGDVAAIRARELATLDASNRALQERIWAIEDEKAAIDAANAALETAKSGISTAFSKLQESVNAEKQRISTDAEQRKSAINTQLSIQQEAYRTQISAAQDAANEIKSIASALSSAVKQTQIDSVLLDKQRLDAARGIIDQAFAGSNIKLPGLTDALTVAGEDSKKFYGTFEAYAFEQGVTNAKIKNLSGTADAQLSAAEQMIKSLEASSAAAQVIAKAQLDAIDTQTKDQQDALDAQLKQGEDQMNALLGIDKSVLSVADAVKGLAAAMSGYAAAQSSAIAAAQSATQSAIAAAVGGAAGGAAGGASTSTKVGTSTPSQTSNYHTWDGQGSAVDPAYRANA